MTTLEMIFLGTVSSMLLFLIGVVLSIVRLFLIRRKKKRLPVRKPKNKQKRRQLLKKKKDLDRKQKTSLRLILWFSLLLLSTGGASAYLSYYQAMNLTTEDSDSVVKGYYLLRDFEEQLQLAKTQGEDGEKLQQNIRYLATAMASYGVKKANQLNTEDGQRALNRYYTSVQQLGMNASTQIKNFYGNAAIVDSTLEDIEKAKKVEKVAMDYYKVDEQAFKEK